MSLLRNLIISAGGELEKRDFNNIDRQDDRWTWRGSASYLVSKRMALRFDVQRRTQSKLGRDGGPRIHGQSRFGGADLLGPVRPGQPGFVRDP